VSNHATHFEENRLPQQTLLEQILDLENMKQAWARVRSNKGAAGIDGMSVADFPKFSQVHMLRIIDQIREGRYAPAPVKRVWIPKPDGWIRRRIRLCYWKDWKVPRKRRRMLIKLGVPSEEVKKASRARKGYWRMSQNSLVRLALNNTYLTKQGVPSMRELWVRFKYGDKAKV